MFYVDGNSLYLWVIGSIPISFRGDSLLLLNKFQEIVFQYLWEVRIAYYYWVNFSLFNRFQCIKIKKSKKKEIKE